MLCVMLFFVVGVQLIFWSGMDSTFTPQDFLFRMSCLICFYGAVTIFSFGNDLDLARGGSAFPRWLFTLPIASIRLAMVPTLSMVIAMGWCWIPFALASVFCEVTEDAVKMPVRFVIVPWLGMSAFGNGIQAIAWWPFRFAWQRVVIIAGAILAFVSWLAFGEILYMGPAYYCYPVYVATIVAFAASIASVFRARHLTWRKESGFDFRNWLRPSSETETTHASHQVDPILFPASFKSQSKALRWRDWKKIGRAPVYLMAAIVIPTVALVAFLHETPVAIVIWVLGFGPSVILALSGNRFGRNSFWKSKHEISHHLAALPVTDHQLLFNRILNLIKASLFTWCIAFLLPVVWYLRGANADQLPRLFSHLLESPEASLTPLLGGLVVVTLYMALVAPWPGFVVGLTGRRRVKLAAIFLFIAMVILAQHVLLRSEGSETDRRMIGPEFSYIVLERFNEQIPILLAIKALVGVAAIGLVIQRKLLSWKKVLYHCLAIAVFLAIFSGLHLALSQTTIAPQADVFWFTLLFCPVGSVFLSYVAFDWNRHR